MAFVIDIPHDLMEAACPSTDFLQTATSLEAFTAVVSTAFNLTDWLHDIEAEGCRLVYLDLSDHPFRVIGDCWSLWGLTPQTAPVGVVVPGESYRINLPFSDDAIARLRQRAEWFGLSEDQPEAVVPAMLRLLAAMQGYERSVDGHFVKPVVRGLTENLERLVQRIPLAGFGGIEDDAESVSATEVWGQEVGGEERRPAFFVFEEEHEHEADVAED